MNKSISYPAQEKAKMFGGDTVKVIKPDGTVTTQPATYFYEITRHHFTRGRSAGKGR